MWKTADDTWSQERIVEAVDRFFPLVVKKLKLCSRNSADLDDLRQCVRIKAVKAFHRAQFEEERNFLSWLGIVTKNAAVECWRRNGKRSEREVSLAEDPPDRQPTSPGQVAELTEAISALHKAMRQLTERQSEVIRLHFYEQFTLEECATKMGLGGRSGPAMALSRGLAKLRLILKRHAP